MQVILKQDVAHVGKKGDVKTVKSGFFRNFLFPKGLAATANSSQLTQLQTQRQDKEKQQHTEFVKWQEKARSIEGRSFTIKAKVNKEGVLFAAVHADDVVKLLKKEGINIAGEVVKFKEPIKKTGSYTIQLMLAPEVIASIIVEVQGQKKPASQKKAK